MGEIECSRGSDIMVSGVKGLIEKSIADNGSSLVAESIWYNGVELVTLIDILLQLLMFLKWSRLILQRTLVMS